VDRTRWITQLPYVSTATQTQAITIRAIRAAPNTLLESYGGIVTNGGASVKVIQ
jgi:hypothetical protein